MNFSSSRWFLGVFSSLRIPAHPCAWLLAAASFSAAGLQSTCAATYPPDSSFLWGNGSVNLPAVATQTEYQTTMTGTGLPYRLLLPANYNASIKYPVVIFLHGMGERGTDNTSQLANNASGAKIFVSTASPNNAATYPCIFVCPQITTSQDWKLESSRVKQLVDTIKANYSVDDNRVALTGYSLGALGSWPIVRNNPNTFSSLVTIAGGGNIGDVQNMEPIAAWLFHAEDDGTVACNYSDQTVATLRSRNISVLYTRYTKGSHGIYNQSYQVPQLVPWLFAQRRGAPISGAPAINIDSLSLAASPLLITGSSNLGSGVPISRVGWCRSNIGGTISGTAARTTSGTNTFTASDNDFTTMDLTNYRVAVKHTVSGILTARIYDVMSVASATTLILDRNASGTVTNAPYSLYKRGGNSNLNPEPGTTTDNWASWSMSVPVSSGTQKIQVISEAAFTGTDSRTTYNIPLTVVYAAPTGDTTAPTLSVSTPATTPYTTTSSSVTMGGSVFDNVGVTGVNWSTDRGYSGTATGPASMWTIPGLTLKPGLNNITVWATDAKNNRATVFRQVIYNADPTADTTDPIVTITSPTAAPTYVTTNVSINLGGTASDNVGVLGLTWTNVTTNMSGPATGTTNWSASAIGLLSGTNVLQVTGTDAAGNSGIATITVVRNQPANQAPTVTMATDQTVTLPAAGTFSGTATDDGLPTGTLTYAWSKVSGPGAVTFSSATTTTTSASFALDGDYVLRLTASDGLLSGSADVNVNVNPIPQSGAQKLLFDFGVSTQTTTGTTQAWNNLVGKAVNSSVSNCVDVSGSATGIGLSITQAFAIQLDNGVTSPSTPYPQTAMRDYVAAQTTPGKINFTGLEPAASYKVTVLGYKKNSPVTNDRVTRYSIGTEWYEVNTENAAGTAVFPRVSPGADGTMEMTVGFQTGSNYGYLNVLELEKLEPTAPLYFDLGVSTQTSSGTTPYWNNLVGKAVNSTVTNCVDATGAVTSVALTITQAFAIQIDNGNTTPSGPYTKSAMRDYVGAQTTPGKLRFSGLAPSASYKLTIYAYKKIFSGDTTGDRKGEYTVGDEAPQQLDAQDNVSNTITFDAASASDGTLDVTADFAPGSIYSYINVMVLQRQ